MANEDGEDWAWIGEQKFMTFRNGTCRDIRFVTLQDARTALGEERVRIREEFLKEIGASWDTLFTATSYDAEMVQGVNAVTLRLILDRICPEDL